MGCTEAGATAGTGNSEGEFPVVAECGPVSVVCRILALPFMLPRFTLLPALFLLTRLAAQEPVSEMIPTPLRENGQPVRLELVIAKPAGVGPFPTVVFNHGSTGRGDNPALFKETWISRKAVEFFVPRGWMVVFPQRRGRGGSEGRYAEGLAADGSGYSCDAATSLAGLERALEDLDAVLAHLRSRPEVDASRLLIAGQSRGGILSVVHAGTRPGNFLGVVNFVGGWMGDQCPRPEAINTVSFVRGAKFTGPILWLYGEKDPFYGARHSRKNFDAFIDAGGQGEFHLFKVGAGANGHFILAYPALWTQTLGEFIGKLPSTPR
jgi:dienelactone hydrolase